MNRLIEDYGIQVFNRDVMKERLSAETYETIIRTAESGEPLDSTIAEEVARAMKEWAIEKGATHFTHWFQPMTGATAEKHDSFLTPVNRGKAVTEFSGKELIKGEPDASSFPSGGLRATFEARGYTAWDPTSYAFIKEDVLCIPTAFCSYGGYALDKKTPLLRSMKAIDKQALRILRLFGNTTSRHVIATVGAEQEYFLIDKELFMRREDLMLCGRTLFGNRPPKAQQMSDHYFGALKSRVKAFMAELDAELWKLGVPAHTEHNEAAPAQHELAPVFATANIACDENQLVMELMRKIAEKHGLVCLLHEKPFEGVNGSGKHNNWALSTDDGINLFKAGKTPSENVQFLLFLCAAVEAVDRHQDLLRISAAGATNDCRLGGFEAPPAVVSVFLGDELTDILTSIEHEETYLKKDTVYLSTGADVLPRLRMDSTDRNRTSPFAFTGNKFEFRMLGSSASIACTNIMLNTMMADVLERYADELEQAEDFNAALNDLLKRTVREHKRIIFNGDGYSEEWRAEAKRRGLLDLSSTVDALAHYVTEENVAMFERQKVLCREEMLSRCEILLESYIHVIRIEAATMIEIGNKKIIPASETFCGKIASALTAKKAAADLLGEPVGTTAERESIKHVARHTDALYENLITLQNDLYREQSFETTLAEAAYCHDVLLADMARVRHDMDALERIVGEEDWPYPTYTDLLFRI